MATGGPEPGPSESSRSCDLSLRGLSEQPWSAFAAALGRDHPLSDNKKKIISKSYVHRFDSDYMGLFGFFPDREDFVVVVCDECNKLVNPQRVHQHVLTYHSHLLKKAQIPPAAQAYAPQISSTPINEHDHRTSSKSQKFNSINHYGVVTGGSSKSGASSLNNKNHSWMRRNPVARSKSFNKLLADRLQKHVSSKEIKANASSAASSALGDTSDYGAKSNHITASAKSILLPSVKLVEVKPEAIIKKINPVVNLKSLVSTSPVVSLTNTQVTVSANSSILKVTHTPTSQVITKNVQEPVKTLPVKSVSKSKFPHNFSLRLTFPLSCISDLTLLKPSVASATSATSATPVTPVTTAPSIVTKRIPVINIASKPPSLNHSSSIRTPVPTVRPATTTNTAINTIRLRNINASRTYFSVTSIDYDQNVPRPSAICTFNNKKFRNQIYFLPKMDKYKEAFQPVNQTQSQLHSVPPLASNYNLANILNGPMHSPHSMNSNGLVHNQNSLRMPSTPVSSVKPVPIGGNPTVFKPLLPKCPSATANTPYNNYQYQNGYTNGVCSPPASLATTSMKRLNPYNITNDVNLDDSKHFRTEITTDLSLECPDSDDDMPNGHMDFSTMELDFDDP